MSFASVKAALARVFGLGETEAHDLVEAFLTDAAPVLDQLRTAIVADVKALLAEADTADKQLAETALADLKAELAAIKALLDPPTPAPPAAS